MMHIAIVSSILHSSYGGPPRVVRIHADALRNRAQVSVYGCAPVELEEETAHQFPEALIFRETWPRRWFRGKGLRKSLRSKSSEFDVLHAHMLWEHSTWASWRVAHRSNKPFVLTPHGSLSAAWRTKALHKHLYKKFVLNALFKDLDLLHVLNEHEANSCRAWGINNRIEIIPNGLPLSEFERTRNPEAAWRCWPVLRNRRVLLYLGRIWSGKGLNILPDAWARANLSDDWLLVLAGPDYRNYSSQLIKLIKEIKHCPQILLTGPVTGDLKDALFAASEAFVLPSYSEGFSMSLLEAVASGLPCLYTTGCHFKELAARGGGIEIEADLDHLAKGIREICTLQRTELRDMGINGRNMAKKQYTAEIMGQALLDVYESIVRG